MSKEKEHQNLSQFSGYTPESLIAYAHQEGVISSQELKDYLFTLHTSTVNRSGHKFSRGTRE